MIGSQSFYFAQPWWLAAGVLAAALAWMGWRNLRALGRTRRIIAIALRCAVVAALAAALARPTVSDVSDQVTLLTVLDRSSSVPASLQDSALKFLADALPYEKRASDRLAVIDVAEAASIGKLPTTELKLNQRTPELAGTESRLADGLQLAMAIAPPDNAVRMLLVSDGNETSGDLKEAARVAAANGIPIDVLPLRYSHPHEVVFSRLVAPSKARSGQTVALRFILNSTGPARGKLLLSLNGQSVDLDPSSPEVGVPVELTAGTNVKTVSVPLGSRGLHRFEAVFVPDGPSFDQMTQNNHASAVTVVAGPGHVLVLDEGDGSADALVKALKSANIDVRQAAAEELPGDLAELLTTDAIVLVNTANSNFTYQQQEMLRRYVQDLGGGLAMVGGPHSFGAGGWINSPVAEVLPVDLDPPQKKQMPKGALVLVMHACEMPNGNFWGKKVAILAVNSLSRQDLAGVLDYGWKAGDAVHWVHPFGLVGDHKAIVASIEQMQMGDMPDLHAPVQAAFSQLKASGAGQKHIIVITDGDPSPPSPQLVAQMKQAGVTCTTVSVFPHNPGDKQKLMSLAQQTGGNYYDVQDPQALPQIFIKEAQIIRRNLIQEEPFNPKLVYSLSEIMRGLGGLPPLDGLVLTGPRGGLTQMVLTNAQGDPVLASAQIGLGRSVAFTSTADSRWAAAWLAWGGFNRFWEQVVRWVSRPAQVSDCEVYAEVKGQKVEVTVEAMDSSGKFVQFADIAGQVIAPDMSGRDMALTQVGPGRYRAEFPAQQAGSYVMNLRYLRPGAEGGAGLIQSPITVPFAPEYRDLNDNTALLSEVAAMTGGRVLGGDPEKADLFIRRGLKFPHSAIPMTAPLLLVWLGLFLSDVAVRRVSVDVLAPLRRLAKALRRPRKAQAAAGTLDRLKLRREKVRQQLSGRAADAAASRRYQAGEGRQAGELPMADASQAPAKPPAQAAGPQEPAPPQEQTPLQRLLKAKQQAADRMRRKGPDET